MTVGGGGRGGGLEHWGSPCIHPPPRGEENGPRVGEMAYPTDFSGLSFLGTDKGTAFVTKPNVHGDRLCFVVKTWARHTTTEAVLNNGWWLAVGNWQLVVVGGWWWLAVGGGWRLTVGGWWSLGAVLEGCP